MLSIIIPTYNEEKYLPLLLKSIKSQDFKDYEIIVADAHSKDNTRKIALKHGCKVIKGGMPARGRNAGAKAAKGELLLFLDADTILPTGFLKSNVAYFRKQNLVCAGVVSKPLSDKFIDKALFDVVNAFNYCLRNAHPRALGWCIFIKKKTFNEIKGFDESLLVGEDVDLCYKTKKYKAFGFIGKKHVYVSVRRLQREGRFRFVIKVMKMTLKDMSLKKIKPGDKSISYKFGGYGKAKPRRLPKRFK